MIQNTLMKAKASCYELDFCTPKFIAEAKDKVEQVYLLAKDINSIITGNSSKALKEIAINSLTAKIMALTQGL